MSKKIIYSKHLEIGRFYLHNDRNGGHPALLYDKNDRKNQYHIIIFTSSPGPRRIKLRHSIEPSKVQSSYAHNLPTVVKRRDLRGKPLTRMKINKEDKPTIEAIKRKK